MNLIEKSVQLGKDLFEINRKTAKEIVSIQMGGMRRYIETNVDAARNVREIKSFPQFAQAQKSYSSTLMAGVQSDFMAGRDVVKSAFEETRDVISSVGAVDEKKVAAKRPAAKKSTRKSAARKTVAKKATRKPRATAAKKAAEKAAKRAA